MSKIYMCKGRQNTLRVSLGWMSHSFRRLLKYAPLIYSLNNYPNIPYRETYIERCRKLYATVHLEALDFTLCNMCVVGLETSKSGPVACLMVSGIP